MKVVSLTPAIQFKRKPLTRKELVSLAKSAYLKRRDRELLKQNQPNC